MLLAGSGSALQARAVHRCVDCDIPFQWDDRPPLPDDPPLPEGFVLTVPMGPRRADIGRADRLLDRYADVGLALGRCWDPTPTLGDRRWGEITLRVSFKRNGDINGVPRVAHLAQQDTSAAASELRTSLLSALSHCMPLNFSASLGNAIAGQIFAIRFVQQGQDQ